jgi:hypothetical protein
MTSSVRYFDFWEYLSIASTGVFDRRPIVKPGAFMKVYLCSLDLYDSARLLLNPFRIIVLKIADIEIQTIDGNLCVILNLINYVLCLYHL